MGGVIQSNARAAHLAALLAIVAFMGPATTLAQTPSPKKNPNAQTRQLESDIEAAATEQAARQAEAVRLQHESDVLQDRLQNTALSAKRLEDALNESEQQLDALMGQEQISAEQLEIQRTRLGKLLGAMQNLERGRPPALLVTPDHAVNAVRSAILLDSLIPEMISQAQSLTADLKNLQSLRQNIIAKQAIIAGSESALGEERRQIESLLAQKLEQQSMAEIEMAQGTLRIQEMSREISSLKGLITTLGRKLPAIVPKPDSEAISLRAGLPPKGAREGPGHNLKDILSPPDALKRFSQAKGNLQFPASGSILVKYGDPDPHGQKSDGLIIATREQSQVVTPFDGKIVYAGPFLDRPQLLLIEAGEGYHILLSGMAVIYGQVGDRLLAGEPIGMMPASSRGGLPQSQPSGPELYLEFRKDGDPINPLPWLAVDVKKVSG